MKAKSNWASLFQKNFWNHITVEPALFFTDIALQIIEFLNTNLYLQKNCRNATLDQEPDISLPCDDETRGLAYVSTYYANFCTLSTTLSLIVTMFATTYSDIIGKRRKPFIVLPIIGMLLQTSSAILQTIFWDWPPLYGVVLNAILPDMLGGFLGIVIFSKVCICDKSQSENRLTRITLLTMVKSAALFLGRGLSGYLLRGFGFFYSYCVVFLLFLMSLISALFLVKDKPVSVLQKVSLGRVFSIKQIYESFKIILFSKKLARHRLALWILQFLGSLVYFAFVGEQSVFYLYFRRRFHWDERQFSAYSAYKVATGMTGGILCTLLMSKWLKIHDSIIGTFAGFMDTLAALGFYLAADNWQIYLVPLVDIFHGIAMSTCFSLMSKFFTDEEYGRLHSVYMLFGLLNSCSIPVYNYLFIHTVDYYPNAFFLLSTFLNGIICITYCVTYFLSYDVR